ncbi:MAG: aa3-type cytochrome oxidase subunit CtaJ [Nakamurella sp.]
MNILQTLTIYVGTPAVIYGGIAACTLLPGRAKQKARYRAGQPWDYSPQWWAGDTPVQVPAADVNAGAARGGARGTW